MKAALDSRSQARLTRALWAARGVMLWEQGAKLWTPWLLAAGALVSAALWGLFDNGGPMLRATVLIGAPLAAAIATVRGALSLRWPTLAETRARLEADSRLTHAPLSALEDARAAGDPLLWELHRKAAVAALEKAKVGRLRAGLAAADPLALRYALLVAAVMALWVRGPERLTHLADPFAAPQRLADLNAGASSAEQAVKGWFAPKAEAKSK